MARKRVERPPLRFRGPPVGMEALAPAELVTAEAAGAGVMLRLPSVSDLAPLPLDASPLPAGASYLRLSLPQTTPPGSYEGTIRLGEQEIPVVAEVESYASLQLAPTQLQLETVPGGETEAHVTALNDGNVGLEIGRAHAFGIFDVLGAERGIRAAFTADTDASERRLDRLIDELADSHGGLVRVQVAEGDGVLDPGAVRDLRVSFRFSDDLEPGHTYSGTWPLHTLRYYVRVAVAPAQEQATRRRRTG